MLVGIEISMVVNMKNIFMYIGMFVVNIWWVYIIKESSVIDVVVYIIDVYLNSCFWEKVGIICEIMLKVGKIIMYILGCLKN